MLRKFSQLGLLLVLFTFVSCGLLWEKPDKRTEATFGFQDKSLSDKQMEEGLDAIRERFKKYGVRPDISATEYHNTFYFVMETSGDAQIIEDLLFTPGNIAFYEVWDTDKFSQFILKASAKFDTHEEGAVNPFLDKFQSFQPGYGPELAYVEVDHIMHVDRYLEMPKVQDVLGEEQGNICFKYGLENKQLGSYPLYAIRCNSETAVSLKGGIIEKASYDNDYAGYPVVNIQMTSEAAKIWEVMTKRASDQRTQIAIVIDDIVYSAPSVVTGPITGGRSSISGSFTEDQVRSLVSILNTNPIPELSMHSFGVQGLLE